jgi:cell division protein FtsL
MARKARKNIRKLKTTMIWIIFMTMFIAELLIYTWCRVQYVGIGYEISKAAHHHQEHINLQNNLKVELASLKSPDRIAKIAKNQLGLKTPTPAQVIIIP